MTDPQLADLVSKLGTARTRRRLELLASDSGATISWDWQNCAASCHFEDPVSPQRHALVEALLTASMHTVVAIERVAKTSQRGFRSGKELRRRLDAYESESRLLSSANGTMREVIAQARLVADFDTTVLITGESGTGKEVLARFIHDRSPRSSEPFVAVNCGAIPTSLVESTLFGHERGAFTGASARHAGVFERAGRGSLLLDELGELPATTQVKLLRVLQEREFEPVGADKSKPVTCRVLAATHRDLAKSVSEGLFREDLFYRLNVFPLYVPALRDRLEDLPQIARELLRRISSRADAAVPPLSAEQLKLLSNHDWPGNVRELSNCLERAFILGGGTTLALGNFADAVASIESRAARSDLSGAPLTLEQSIRRAITAALSASGGKLYGADGAAAMLEVKPSTLQWKMKKLGISRTDFSSDDR